jgi:HlyD family secretion protein
MPKTLPAVPLPALDDAVGEPEFTAAPHPLRRRVITWIAVVIVLGASMVWWRNGAGSRAPVSMYRTTTIQRGNITQTVSATGPLSAVATVNVGSQVSGNIAKLHVDFNDHVTAGQLIAEIEPSTYEARLVQAQGDLLNAKVALELKRISARRNEALNAEHLIAQSEYDQGLADLHQQEAIVQIKEAAVKSATVDLERTKIRSPIDGVVIDRAIDVGQTVQASFAAPTLFILAQDLRQMQITANVSEADIGGVVPGRPVTFTVDAFPGENFSGQVRQVRNNTTTTNNVVTYPTIITVDNPELKLRPGMTANVTIIVAQRADVLRAPNAALRLRPGDNSATPHAAASGARRVLYVPRGDVDDAGRARGELDAVPVQTGLSDATFTEIISGISAGQVVVTGPALTAAPAKSTGATSTNPFMPKMPPKGSKR